MRNGESRLLLSILLVLTCAVTMAQAEVDPPGTGVTVRELSGAKIVEAVLPGSSLGTTPIQTTPAKTGGLAILLAPEDDPDGPRSLYLFDPTGPGSLVELAHDLPAELDAVDRLDLGGDGSEEVIVGQRGKIYTLGTLDDVAARRLPRLLLDAPSLDLRQLRRRGLIAADRADLVWPSLGRLDVYRFDGRDVLELANEVELPVRARRVRTGLELSTPRVRLLEHSGGPPLVVVGPELQGKRRLLTTLIDPSSSEPAGSGEAWARFTTNERIAQSWYVSVDGRPMLAVAALAADKLGLFEKKKLRVFPLRTDRTRAGSPPALEIQTATRNWYDLGVHVADLELDGRDDLVVIQPDGLGAKKLAVEAYRGKGNGGFFLTPRRSVVVAPQADWFYGTDLDGDRVPDLVATADGRLLVFRGLGTSKKKGVIEKTPHWSFEAAELGDGPDLEVVVHIGDGGDSDGDSDSDSNMGRLQVADLDGDGRGEILLSGEIGGRAVFRVIELR